MWDTLWGWVKDYWFFVLFVLSLFVVISASVDGCMKQKVEQGRVEGACVDKAKTGETLREKDDIYDLCIKTQGELP